MVVLKIFNRNKNEVTEFTNVCYLYIRIKIRNIAD